MKRETLPSLWLLTVILVLVASNMAKAQSGSVPLYTERLMPGAIGQMQLMKGRGIPGHIQPVKLIPPAGTKIAPVIEGSFADDLPSPQTFGCVIGAVYRFRLSEIPLHPGAELFPTVEVIDRTYPPAGMELQFPIPIQITQDELQYALEGKFVTRVIYLENPRTAVPNTYEPSFQPWFEVEAGQDPVVTADLLGRPVAILRLGSRRPTQEDMPGEFTYQSPPIQLFGNPPPAPANGVEVPMEQPVPATAVPMQAQRPMMPPYGVPPQMAQPYQGAPQQPWYPSQR
ncbi:hypothetical protein AB1L30_16030 [Bremerella sp. JC817]|uniref:hypothetical protein n=1 Tax=Bremerella sp. JC817 TaxID=3231756 RepID=UPI003459BD90